MLLALFLAVFPVSLMVIHRIAVPIMLYLGPQIGAAKDQVGADVPVFERMTQVAITGLPVSVSSRWG